MLSVTTNGKAKNYTYDNWGNLSKTVFEDGKTELRNPDKAGNLFESLDRKDRQYARGGQLVKTPNWEYKYDKEGILIRKKDRHGATWRYEWNAAGMLERVTRPDAREISFKYDALGRRIEKRNGTVVTRWVWDGNVPLHEMVSQFWQKYDKDKHQEYWDEEKRPTVTWVFEEGTFVPAAKLTGKKKLSIVSNYMGTPEAMYREDGEKVWSCELNSYGKIRNYQGEYKTECPFRYQGQYHDGDTGLYYNRFRYYDPDMGSYLSQDPIRLNGGMNLYSYVSDTNEWVDIWGLRIASPSPTVSSTPTTTVYGTGQVTGIGHAPAMENVATQMRDSGSFKDVYMDLSWNTANHTSTGQYSSISQNRPDIIAVTPDGKVVAIEVASASDRVGVLERRNSIGTDRSAVLEYKTDYNPITGELTESGKAKVQSLCQ